MSKIFVRPSREGLLVREPGSERHLPPAGREVETNSYWVRRIQTGDVVVGKSPSKLVRTRAAVKEKKSDAMVRAEVDITHESGDT